MGKLGIRLILCGFADVISGLPTNLSTAAVETFRSLFVQFGVALEDYL